MSQGCRTRDWRRKITPVVAAGNLASVENVRTSSNSIIIMSNGAGWNLMSQEQSMLRILCVAVILGAGPALAQGGMDHRHGQMAMRAAVPTQPGQGAFAAIQEIVELLEADPHTDWSKVDIEALRQHLIDMSNVTLAAHVRAEPVEGGERFVISGSGDVRESIKRMVMAHAKAMDGVAGWRFAASEVEDGAVLTVEVPEKDRRELRALGFIGVLARGMHHQQHHLMIARGEHPHD
jgi:hypothetical protein